ncbi:hypothetical protein B0I35DRAFT_41266 [Stachybotrys elegans]|uniref:Uncharacterized protein n=1 Tax=Stachybotrys elegans TaxID=80388 RepID=A0A8K0WYV4_9HYPO|nr:hypothetical protein B0I35DRAFT_41266 [Stachybotrys elegans]
MKKPWRSTTGSNAANGSPARSSLVRSKTGSESIRGRISGPIPIANPLEGDYSGHKSNGNAAPGNGATLSNGLETTGDTPEPRTENSEPIGIATSSMRGTILSSKSPEPDHILSTSAQSSTLRETITPLPRANAQARYSAASMSAGTERSMNSKEPQRKKSTLRGALGRLFGRKKNTDSSATLASSTRKATPNPSPDDQIQHQQQQQQQQPESIEQKRSFSLPISQYDRALRSHSVGPDDVLAIESARNSVSVDYSFTNRRSRAGYHTHARRATDSDWTGLSPRPLSSHARVVGIGIAHSPNISDPENIGRAITCDTANKRRRSRSLSGLPDLEEDHGDVRRRSDEIRYWRESYDPNLGRPMSTLIAEGEATNAYPAEDLNTVDEQPPTTPLKPFSFGDIKELAGMKITQAASMDTRISSLESRMRRMERVVTQLCNAVPNFQPHGDNDRAPTSMPLKGQAHLSVFASGGLDHKGWTRPSTQQSDMSKMSFGDAPTFVGSIPTSNPAPAFALSQRPISTATIRAAASLPSFPKESNGNFTVDQYATLTALLETERASRQALEAQVKSLGHQIAIMAKNARKGDPQDSNDDFSPTGRSFGQRSVFDQDDDDYQHKFRTLKGERVPLEDSGIATGDADEDDYSEAFITPHEHAHTNGVFGQDHNEEDDTMKRKTARTMSLSQMTLKKSPQAVTADVPPPGMI